MKVLVIGGMHGNEPLGPTIVKLFQNGPIKNVGVVLANEQAIEKNCRFVKSDLNRSFPGNIKSKGYELKRAAQLLQLAKKYDVVLDFHNTHCPDNDCGFVGQTAPQQLCDVAAWFGLNRIIVADYDCINKYAPNCLSVEISLDGEQMDAEWWYNRICALVKIKQVPEASNLKLFRFAYRMTLDDKVNLQLPNQNLKAFEPINSNLCAAMGVAAPAYPIFIGDKYTPYNYGGLLNSLN